MENPVNDISLEEMFQAMYQHDFNEPELTGASTILKCSEISCEDRKFMEIVDGEPQRKMNIMSCHCNSMIQIWCYQITGSKQFRD